MNTKALLCVMLILMGCGRSGDDPPMPQPKPGSCVDEGDGIINCGEEQYRVLRVYQGLNGPADVLDVRAASQLINKVRGTNDQDAAKAIPAPTTTAR